MASDLRLGFQLAHISEPSTRMVGRSSARERCESVCASSIQATRKPSRDLMDSRCVILHALEDDEAFAGRFYPVVEDAEQRPDTELLDLLLDEPLCRLCQSALNLADADGSGAELQDARLDEELGEEVALAATPASVSALVAGWLQERLEDVGCPDTELSSAFRTLGNGQHL